MSDIVSWEVIEFDVFQDQRGSLECPWDASHASLESLNFNPCSLNFSYNANRYTMRGLHFQSPPFAQKKLVTCVTGSAWDVTVDLRRDSPTYKLWSACKLEAQSGRAAFIPAGCAHGFLTLEDNVTLSYLIEGTYRPECSAVLNWRDPDIGIQWPECEPILSDKDRTAPLLRDL